MTQHPNFESVQETLNHIHFQMDLLKLVNMPVELTGLNRPGFPGGSNK